MRPMNLEAETETFGAADVEQLTWKNLLDGYSCTECGRCTAACPANITGKVLSPRKIVVNTRQRLMERGPVATGSAMPFLGSQLVHGEGQDAAESLGNVAGHRLLDGYITEEELWQCTSCRACVQECPVSIDQLDIINQMRRNLVLSESRFPAEMQPAFEALERNGAPWAFNAADRARWADGMAVPTMAEFAERGERPAVLFWVGCMGSFDDRAKKISVAFARDNDISKAPRETLPRALPLVDLVERPRARDRGLCCGAGGGRMWMEEPQGKRINIERTEELLATGAETIAVACPFYITMISD